jgi:transcriptional regulator with XRE-family HTH domain
MPKTKKLSKSTIKVTNEDPKQVRRAEIGDRLRALRKGRNLNLVELSEELASRGYSLSASQLSRIETGAAPANTDDLSELVDYFKVSWEELLGPRKKPWFIVRNSTARDRVEAVKKGDRQIVRSDESHTVLIKKHIYHYIPLEQSENYVLPGDEEEGVRLDEPMMQKYLFEIGTVDADIFKEGGLDSHPGEEIIYVIEGELEFWFHQEASNKKADTRILKKGDCLQYPSSLRHGYRATGESGRAEALFVYCNVRTPPPIVEERLRKQIPKR